MIDDKQLLFFLTKKMYLFVNTLFDWTIDARIKKSVMDKMR